MEFEASAFVTASLFYGGSECVQDVLYQNPFLHEVSVIKTLAISTLKGTALALFHFGIHSLHPVLGSCFPIVYSRITQARALSFLFGSPAGRSIRTAVVVSIIEIATAILFGPISPVLVVSIIVANSAVLCMSAQHNLSPGEAFRRLFVVMRDAVRLVPERAFAN
jgi:hypothetical protein